MMSTKFRVTGQAAGQIWALMMRLHPYQLPPAFSVSQSPCLCQHEYPFRVARAVFCKWEKYGGKWDREEKGKCKGGKSSFHGCCLIWNIGWIIFLESKKGFFSCIQLRIKKCGCYGWALNQCPFVKVLWKQRLDRIWFSQMPLKGAPLTVFQSIFLPSVSPWSTDSVGLLECQAHPDISKVGASTALGFIWGC